MAINDLGETTGCAALDAVLSDTYAVIWQPGSSAPTYLGTLGEGNDALGINNVGQVVGRYSGSSYTDLSAAPSLAYLWDAVNGMRELFPLPGYSSSRAKCINDLGEVSGEVSDYSGDPNTHAVLWPAGSPVPVDLGTLPGDTYSAGGAPGGRGINLYGQVVGASGSLTNQHGFLWSPGAPGGTSGVMIDLGTLGGAVSSAVAVNTAGTVVGTAQTPAGHWHPFLWTPETPNGAAGAIADLGALDGTDAWGYCINDAGEVVGNGYASGVEHAFTYTGGVMTDLNTLMPVNSGWVLKRAVSVNNHGQIVGYGTVIGAIHSYLLTPVSADTTSPTTTAALNPTTPNGSNGWYTAPVTVTLSATDPDGPTDVKATYFIVDGGAQQTYTAPFAVSGDGSHTVNFWSVDQAGNKEAANSVAVSIDQKPPVITLTAPTAGPYLLNQAVTANFSAIDATSGVASVVGTAPNGSSIDTSSAGITTFTVTATDNAGNTATQSLNYTVAYAIAALYDQTKAVKSGATIPIKLELTDASGADVSTSAIVIKAIGVTQVSTSAPGVLEDAGSANPDSDFRFDSTLGTAGGYIFNLQTTGYLTGTYTLNFTAGADPTVHAVGFQVK